MSKPPPGGHNKVWFTNLMPLLIPTSKLKRNLLIAGILLIAFAFRIIAIDKIPAGLSHDEAYNGVTAIQVLEGERRIFFEINKGIEPLIIYLEAVAFNFFGIGPVPLRLVNVFFGLLTVALVYPFTARLFNRQVAFLTMAGLAISFWAIFVSRLTLRAVLLPPLVLLTIYFCWRGLSPITTFGQSPNHHLRPISNLVFFALSGLAAGITMYTYLSSRFVPFIVLAIFGYQLLRRQVTRQHWLGLFIHFFIWALLFAPLANYYLDNSESFTRRSNQVTTIPQALDGDFGPLIRNTFRTLGMFTFRGDTTDRYNLNGRPVFDWVNGLLFYLGLGLVLWRFLPRSPRVAGPAVVLLSLTFFMLLPDFVTDDSPHFLRTIGALPLVYIFWAIGLNSVASQLNQWQPSNFILHSSPLILLLLTLTTIHTSYDYFFRWAAAPNARYIYGADIAEIAQHLKSNPSEDLTVISAEYYEDLDPFRFALHFGGHPPFVIWFDGRQSLAFPPPESNLSPRYVFPISAPPANIWSMFLKRSPEESGREYDLYRLREASPIQPFQDTAKVLGVNVNDDLIVFGYQILGDVVSGGKFQVLISWQALHALPPGTDYTFLVQMRDSQNHLWLNVDGLGYAPADWQPSVWGLQLLTLRLPGDLPPRAYQLTLQVVDRHSGQALPIGDSQTVIPLELLMARLADKPHQIDLERLPNPISLEDNDPANPIGLRLRGYELASRTVQSGDKLALTLHWQVREQPQQDFQLQFFLVDNESNIVYRWPALEPVGGEWPTSHWLTDYWVQDKLDLPIDLTVPVGIFKLHGKWIDPSEQNLSPNIDETSIDFGEIAIGSGK